MKKNKRVSVRRAAVSSMRFDVLTIFPKIFNSYLRESLFARAVKHNIISVAVHDIRRFSTNRHKKVDDKPFGGGPGMVMQIQPIYDAVEFVKVKGKRHKATLKTRTILFSTRGELFDAASARRLAKYGRLIFICGRYEGVDERVAQNIADEELSVGPYILSGGEIPALAVMEAVARHIPGFLGKEESLEEKNGSFPTYTRPAVFAPRRKKAAWKVPKVLLSGDHEKIRQWRQRM